LREFVLDIIRVRAYNVITEVITMKARIVKIGNSQGIRIPKPLILQAGLKGEVQLEVQDDRLVISRVRRPRAKWALAFGLMAQRGDDKLLDGEVLTASQWDEEGWQWR